jgi:hypothetical protein
MYFSFYIGLDYIRPCPLVHRPSFMPLFFPFFDRLSSSHHLSRSSLQPIIETQIMPSVSPSSRQPTKRRLTDPPFNPSKAVSFWAACFLIAPISASLAWIRFRSVAISMFSCSLCLVEAVFLAVYNTQVGVGGGKVSVGERAEEREDVKGEGGTDVVPENIKFFLYFH